MPWENVAIERIYIPSIDQSNAINAAADTKAIR